MLLVSYWLSSCEWKILMLVVSGLMFGKFSENLLFDFLLHLLQFVVMSIRNVQKIANNSDRPRFLLNFLQGSIATFS